MPSFNTIVLSNVNTIVLGSKSLKVLDSSPMRLGERLKLARRHAELSQEELGDKAGCGQGVVSKIERGDQESTAYVVKLAIACGVSIEWLDSETGEMLPRSPFRLQQNSVEYKLQQVIEQMDERQKQQLLKISHTLTEPEDNGHTPEKGNGTQ